MDERWSGDGTYYLPARQVEPYRLWFEFLKQAHRDADIEIDLRTAVQKFATEVAG